MQVVKLTKTQAHLHDAVAVIRASFATVAEEFGFTEQNAPTNGAFLMPETLRQEWDGATDAYAVWQDGRMAGYMQLWENSEGDFELQRLAVLPGYRGAGLGDALLARAKSVLAKSDKARISIGIIEENTALRRWYEKRGFVHLGTKKFKHLPFAVGFLEYIKTCHRE